MQRAYEMMIIHDGELDDAAVQDEVKTVRSLIEDAGCSIAKVDFWGRRRFAYPINHKNDGYYSVYEIVADGGALDPVERSLRIADTVVRHKVIRLPEDEAARRGLLGAGDGTDNSNGVG